MVEFVMPALGADMSSGTLMAWRKQPGEAVERGDIIAEVHTDKTDIEVEVFTSGVIEKLLVEPGAKVPVGTPLAVIREDGAAPSTQAAAPAAEPTAPAAGEPGHARILASPSAKALAEELHVDLAGLHGSGPGGRIQRSDVESAAKKPAASLPEAAPPPAAAPPATPPKPAPAPADDRQAGMRQAIAAAMARSKREIPHFYLSETIDMSNTIRWLAEENLHRPVQSRLLPGAVMLKAVALAVRDVPELNATWEGEQLRQRDAVHLGIAIFLRGGGLVAPALHDADTLSLDDLMHGLNDLVSRARANRLRSSEYSDPTITVTSLGERGAESLLPVIIPPQVAIVGFGRLVERPWISDGQILPCPVVHTTLAADHRVTDGHRAGAFLSALERRLQEPENL